MVASSTAASILCPVMTMELILILLIDSIIIAVASSFVLLYLSATRGSYN
jgi:hypothetical protein